MADLVCITPARWLRTVRSLPSRFAMDEMAEALMG